MPTKKQAIVKKCRTTKDRALLSVENRLNFIALVSAIQQVHEQSASFVNRTVNTTLTLRNWVIGGYIREYEQRGADRAKYGTLLLERLSDSLQHCLDRSYTGRYLGLCRQLFDMYPEIRKSVISEFKLLPLPDTLRGDASPEIQKSLISESGQTNLPIRRSLTAQSASTKFITDARMLIEHLSFTHLEQLITIEDPLKRAFYEIECIRGNWSVRALKRQIATLYFERSGLSKDKEKLAAMVKKGIETAEPKFAIRDPYIFEFLGLRAKDAVSESDLEAALVENLREFLLELGHGFCLEAQQKSIVIGKTRGFVDLVFYHRVLKCHVLVELKVDAFKHDHLGQLNTYVTWYRRHMMSPGDNLPVGLLLCTDKDHALVEYATASMDNQLFVSNYAVKLPSKDELEKFLHAKHLEMLGESVNTSGKGDYSRS
jgi:predicted nuclease of restriction endonuclease-like (RecB) superfamily